MCGDLAPSFTVVRHLVVDRSHSQMATWHTATANVSRFDRRTAILRFSSSLLAATRRSLFSKDEQQALVAEGRWTSTMQFLVGEMDG
eukprot:SAG31_NODE_1707_length_7484_cov_8.798104_8_plen_87_part_00